MTSYSAATCTRMMLVVSRAIVVFATTAPRNCSIYASPTGKTMETELPAVPFVSTIDPIAGRCNQFPTATKLIG